MFYPPKSVPLSLNAYSKRGKVPEYLELLKIVIGALKAAGVTERKVYADIAESMDTIFHEMEVDSLDAYFELKEDFL